VQKQKQIRRAGGSQPSLQEARVGLSTLVDRLTADVHAGRRQVPVDGLLRQIAAVQKSIELVELAGEAEVYYTTAEVAKKLNKTAAWIRHVASRDGVGTLRIVRNGYGSKAYTPHDVETLRTTIDGHQRGGWRGGPKDLRGSTS